MLPVRAALESVGYNVYWDHTNRTVMILSISAMDLLLKSQEVMYEVDGFDSVAVTEMVMEVEGVAVTTTSTVEMTTFMDPLSMRMAMTTVISDGTDTMELDSKMYIIHEGDYLITYMYLMDEWSKVTAPFSQELLDELMRMSTADMMAEFYKDAQIVGTERIRGIDTFRVDVVMNLAGIFAMLEGMQGMEVAAQMITDELFAALGDMTTTLWIAKDSFYTVRMDIDMSEMMSEIMAEMGVVVSRVSMSMTSFNFNNPTPFTLPEEVADAVEMELPEL